MESYILKIGGRESGSLLQNKTFVPLNGPILSVSNSSPFKPISLTRAAWDPSGSRFVASDCMGNVFLFHPQKNRFHLVQRLNLCSSFLCFTSDRTQDILVALTDCTVVSLNSEIKVVKNKFYHHTSPVTSITFDGTGHIVLSCSKDQAILWDLRTFGILRILTLKKNVDIVKVFFLPDQDIIVSAFQDNSVFLWDYKHFRCIHQFVCDYEGSFLNMKTVDASNDGQLIACAGKANWFLIWSVPEQRRLCSVLLPSGMSVKQVSFLPSVPGSSEEHILSLLSSEGEIHVYNLKQVEHLHKLSSSGGKFSFFSNSTKHFQLLTVSLQGYLELYDISDFIVDRKNDEKLRFGKVYRVQGKTIKPQKRKIKEEKEGPPAIDKSKLKLVLRNYGEYPEKHRFFIWSQLLELPHNEDAFNVVHQESLNIAFNKDYSFMNPGVRKTFCRMMSMLACWHPVIQEIDYFQCVVFPFVKVLHKSTISCFEVLITFISNWCQNWFLFCPFPPFNIVCVVENMIAFHDPELMMHFVRMDIPAEVYSWSLLQTSFSEVFNRSQWLVLWDHIFSNSLAFPLYVVAAYSVVLRDVLLRCQTMEQFKQCYRKHAVSASVVVKKAYALREALDAELEPDAVTGSFVPLPKGAYPSFIQMSHMNLDLETHTRRTVIDQEMDYIKQREDALDIRSNYLRELQMLQQLRRKMFLDCIDTKDEDSLENLNRKLRKVQKLMQENLTDQITMLKEKIGEDIYIGNTGDLKAIYFEFKDFMKRMKNKR